MNLATILVSISLATGLASANSYSLEQGLDSALDGGQGEGAGKGPYGCFYTVQALSLKDFVKMAAYCSPVTPAAAALRPIRALQARHPNAYSALERRNLTIEIHHQAPWVFLEDDKISFEWIWVDEFDAYLLRVAKHEAERQGLAIDDGRPAGYFETGGIKALKLRNGESGEDDPAVAYFDSIASDITPDYVEPGALDWLSQVPGTVATWFGGGSASDAAPSYQ